MIKGLLKKAAAYLVAAPVHLALAGLALAFLVTKAGDGDTDWIFWLCFSWIALQTLSGRGTLVLSGLALAFLAIQASDTDRDWIFWLCFSWIALQMLHGGLTLRVLRRWRRSHKAHERPPTEGWEWKDYRPYAASFCKAFATGRWQEAAREHAAGEGRDDAVDTRATKKGGSEEGLVSELERLAALHSSGALSDEEFEQAKKRLLE